MQNTYIVHDKLGCQHVLRDALMMGYNDYPTIRLEAHSGGYVDITPDAFEQLAVAYLRAHGYLVIDSSKVVNEIAEKQSQPVESLRPGY